MAVPAVAAIGNGRLAQLVRALPSHGRGQRFKSFVAHHSFSFSHIVRGQTSQVRFFVLNLLFRSGSTLGLMPFDGCESESHAVAGKGTVLYSASMLNFLRTLEFLGWRLLRTRTFASLATPTALCVVLMILLTVVSQHAVSPKMAALRVQMGSIQAFQARAADSPLLAEFSRLHRISVSLESGVLLAGFVAMYLMVRELASLGH